MNSRTTAVLGLALICGLAAAIGVSRMGGRPAPAAAVETVPVVVAAVAVPRGNTVTPDVLVVKQWPKGTAPEGSIVSVEAAANRAVITPLAKDEPILESKLAPADAGRGLAAMVPDGMRAFTINTPTVSSVVAGFILPGNKIDVLLTREDRDKSSTTGGGVTATLLQNLEILAVQQHVSAPAENRVDVKQLQSVTLLVTPSQAQLLSLAQKHGELHLSLRGNQDQTAAITDPVTARELSFLQEPPGPTREELAALEARLAREQAERERLEAEMARREPAEPPPPPPLPIRTLRGSQWGQLYIQERPRQSRQRAAGPQTPARLPQTPSEPPRNPPVLTDATTPGEATVGR